MKDMKPHPLVFIPAGATTKTQWQTHSPAPAVAHSENGEQFCTVELPHPTQYSGSWKITCEHCPAWALVNVYKSVSDPKSFTMPCGRIIFEEP